MKEEMVQCPLPMFTSAGRRRKESRAPGRVPRISRLLALAVQMDKMVCTGTVNAYADLAKLGHVSRARISQVTSLSLLAPDIQEEILFLPCVRDGREPLRMRQVLPITVISCWQRQRQLWRELKATLK